MSEIDIATTIYIIFMIVATFVSFKYGSNMIRKTGLFLPQALIAGTINLALGLFSIIGWFFFAWGVNEFLFFGGLVLGIGLLVVCEAVLITTLFLKRKKWIQIYNETFN
ncbi:hypothetical protein [Pontibacillus sp. HMF3514]|uniref:hypothetical protein n=1 Tax=Pontibacillus sp. HMF3514 TaxID=2692425 RepID=UPI001320065A|nr:hypothetical protein [Pontibacillus sp. HMF3514]QHE54305.1 hypothetical protein GS400_11890 [Pontibacillus sp. HMF3514]